MCYALFNLKNERFDNMDNQPNKFGRPGATESDPVNQTDIFADARSISDVKNKGKNKDDATNKEKGEKETPLPEDFEPFNLDAVADKKDDDK